MTCCTNKQLFSGKTCAHNWLLVENHIQFLYIGVRLWADIKFQNQFPAVQTILTDGVDKLGDLGSGGEGALCEQHSQQQATKWDTR